MHRCISINSVSCIINIGCCIVGCIAVNAITITISVTISVIVIITVVDIVIVNRLLLLHGHHTGSCLKVLRWEGLERWELSEWELEGGLKLKLIHRSYIHTSHALWIHVGVIGGHVVHHCHITCSGM